MTGRLDEEKLESLRRWGEGLAEAPTSELRAAGRAILMLVEEIEQLHVDLWHGRREFPGGSPEPRESDSGEVVPEKARAMTSSLQGRLDSIRRRGSRIAT